MTHQVLRAYALCNHTPLPSSSSSLFIRNDPSGCMGAFLEEQESWIFGSHFMTCPYAVTRHREQLLRGGGTRQCSSSPRVPGAPRREADNDAASSPRPSPASPGTPRPLTHILGLVHLVPALPQHLALVHQQAAHGHLPDLQRSSGLRGGHKRRG